MRFVSMRLGGVLFLIALAWLALQVTFAALLRVQVKLVQFGISPGPGVAMRGLKLRLGVLPLGAFVTFDPDQLARLSVARFTVLMLAPWLTLGGLALLAGGAPTDFLRGLTLPVRVFGALARWADWNNRMATTPLVAIGQLAARMAAFNLLPVSSLAGEQVLARLLPERARVPLRVVSFTGLVVALAVSVARTLT